LGADRLLSAERQSVLEIAKRVGVRPSMGWHASALYGEDLGGLLRDKNRPPGAVTHSIGRTMPKPTGLSCTPAAMTTDSGVRQHGRTGCADQPDHIADESEFRPSERKHAAQRNVKCRLDA
jgi:hypothetical protein